MRDWGKREPEKKKPIACRARSVVPRVSFFLPRSLFDATMPSHHRPAWDSRWSSLRAGYEPRPPPVDGSARSQADDGSAQDRETATGRRRMEPQRPECGQLRRVKGEPLSRPARRFDNEKWCEGHDSRAMVGETAARDPRGFRPGGLWPDSQERAQRDVGSNRKNAGKGRQGGGCDQEAHWPCR